MNKFCSPPPRPQLPNMAYTPVPNKYGKRKRSRANQGMSGKRVKGASFRKAVRSVAEYRLFQASANDKVGIYQPVAIDISAIAQGVARDERAGQKVQITNLHLKASLFSSASSAYQRGRLIVVKWNEYTTPLYTQILTAASSLTCEGNLEIKTTSAFRILYDKRFALNSFPLITPSTDAVIWQDRLNHTVDVNLKNCGDIAFEGTSTTKGKGKLFMFWFSNNSSNGPGMDFVSGLGFKDY